MDNATIAAIATPAGVGGIGVVRVSGNEAAEIAGAVFRRGATGHTVDLRRTASHRLLFGRVVDPATEATIDEVLLAWMAGPRAYTREDPVELSCHGGPVPLRETLRVLLAAGGRPCGTGGVPPRGHPHGPPPPS